MGSETLEQFLGRMHQTQTSFDELAQWYWEEQQERHHHNDRIATLERERDEARALREKTDSRFTRLYSKHEDLKALCGEAADAAGMYELGDDLYKRLRAAKGE